MRLQMCNIDILKSDHAHVYQPIFVEKTPIDLKLTVILHMLRFLSKSKIIGGVRRKERGKLKILLWHASQVSRLEPPLGENFFLLKMQNVRNGCIRKVTKFELRIFVTFWVICRYMVGGAIMAPPIRDRVKRPGVMFRDIIRKWSFKQFRTTFSSNWY